MNQKISFSNLDVTITEGDTKATYTFQGEVDENFSHIKVPRIRKEILELQLGGIEQFNSVGIREWIFMIQEFKNNGQLILQDCSVAVIDQINMVPDSLGNGIIESFFAPYYCDCGIEVNKRIESSRFEEQLVQYIAPSFTCECGKALDFDALEESYFQFMNIMKRGG